MDQSGQKWTKVDQSGQKWKKVDQSGPKWTKVDKSGQKWTKVDRVGKDFPHILQCMACSENSKFVKQWGLVHHIETTNLEFWIYQVFDRYQTRQNYKHNNLKPFEKKNRKNNSGFRRSLVDSELVIDIHRMNKIIKCFHESWFDYYFFREKQLAFLIKK